MEAVQKELRLFWPSRAPSFLGSRETPSTVEMEDPWDRDEPLALW